MNAEVDTRGYLGTTKCRSLTKPNIYAVPNYSESS